MTIIHIHCAICGTCNKPASTEVCVLVPNKPSRGLLPSKINFVCEQCGEHEQKLTERDVQILRYNGVLVETYDVPMEIIEPHSTGPQFTYDDILDLQQELEVFDSDLHKWL
jgi:hypothetical protein